MTDSTFSTRLIAWQQQHGRQQLPWQNTRDAYRIWLSEIMLQQTQVATVIPYFERFIARFPDIATLAAADIEDVMAMWSGLGYYARARNLHRCAQQVIVEHEGIFPINPASIAQLPGIGRSTAAAIAVFTTGQRAAILDGNVKRVLCRVFGIEGEPGSKAIENALWQRAEDLLPDKELESYTQGLMDLGATVCTRNRPACTTCPFFESCNALTTDRVAELPTRKHRKPLPQKQVGMLIIVDQGELLLHQRPAKGIWGGLWSLPEFKLEDSVGNKQTAELAATTFGQASKVEALESIAHTFTHYRLQITPWQVKLAQRKALDEAYFWLKIDRLTRAPLPAPIRKLLARL